MTNLSARSWESLVESSRTGLRLSDFCGELDFGSASNWTNVVKKLDQDPEIQTKFSSSLATEVRR